jgi:hypothetical protein
MSDVSITQLGGEVLADLPQIPMQPKPHDVNRKAVLTLERQR